GKNVVISMPTASGKTIIAYAAIMRALKLGMKALYMVPLRALAMEKFEELNSTIGKEYKIILSMGDFDTSSDELKSADVVVAVFEKIDSVLRHDPEYIYNIGVIVADEVHILQDPGRGPTLEMILTRLKYVNNQVQLVALSATIKNYYEIADWLNADIVYSEFRPVPLRLGIYSNGVLKFEDGLSIRIKEDNITIGNLVKRSLENHGQVLVFVNTRTRAENLAYKIGNIINEYAEKIELPQVIDEDSNIYDEKIKSVMKFGACFHHAGLSNVQRKFVEKNFKEGKIKCLVATPTLAAGVNLPARTVIVRDISRFTEDGMVEIPAFEIKQMLGRAGRPKYDSYGEGIIVSKKANKELKEFKEIDDIESQLENKQSLRMHVLGLIASGIVESEEDVINFFNKTFLAYRGAEDLEYFISDTLNFLENEELVTNVRKLRATPFGKMISDLYLDPVTGIAFRNSLEYPYSDLYALYVISSVGEMVPLISKDEEYEIPDHPGFERFDKNAFKTALMLQAWMNETDMNDILTEFNIGPGDVHMRVELADWLLYSYTKLSMLEKYSHSRDIENLWRRVRHGVRPELLELVRLKNIGRMRARRLYNLGYRSLKDIANADPKKLSMIPGIGEKLAKSIVNEANNIKI
ncbi:MAG: DEAD/DEAH box helicase, partial [Thermoplasmata archaeon]|nr:DEAD/DEAH box helicase [Thermoplasmata archaeon]